VTLTRASGILLHITSLPGELGIGTLGKHAVEFIDFLQEADQKYWQILPLGPTGYGDSPYQTFSAVAGNPLLIDLQELVESSLLSKDQLIHPPVTDHTRIDYGSLINWKTGKLQIAFRNFHETADFLNFCEKEKFWLDDYSLFAALKIKFQGDSWLNWETPYKKREPLLLEKAASELQNDILYQKFLQFIFYQQWEKIRSYARQNNIAIIGDIPIFVAMDSSDSWAENEIFQFDTKLIPQAVAGVPPDFFSATGQLWGNPLYNWDHRKETGFSWWEKRFKASLKLTDLVRVDHFRGFAGYWSVPFGEDNAINGKWISAPGEELFTSLRSKLGNLPVIAEDLGVITDDVIALRDKFEFPGMKILQFAFGFWPDLYSDPKRSFSIANYFLGWRECSSEQSCPD